MIDFTNAITCIENELSKYADYHDEVLKSNTPEDKALRYLTGKLSAVSDIVKLVGSVKDFITANPGQEVPSYWNIVRDPQPSPAVEPLDSSVTHTINIEDGSVSSTAPVA